MTPQEINEKVAKKLGFGEWVDQQVSKGGNLDWSPKDYCGSIEAAFSLLGKKHFMLRHDNKKWRCWINQRKNNIAEDTAPMAICKAFLKLEEEK